MAATGGNRVQIESTDLLFLHPLDHPGQSLVTDVFNGDDFENWRRYVTIALSAKQKLSFIDGSYENPNANFLYYHIGRGEMTWYLHGS